MPGWRRSFRPESSPCIPWRPESGGERELSACRSAPRATAGTNTARSPQRKPSREHSARPSASGHPELALAPRLLMASSPVRHVPAAATTLARRLQPVLNAARTRRGLAPAPLLRVDRISTSAGDYGTLSAQARDLHMAANALSFRRFRPAQVCDAHLLVVDDVRVTGAHQRCLMRASEDLPLAARTFLYIATFPGQQPAASTPRRKTRSTTPRLRRSTTWPESWKPEISPGTSACASSPSTRPTTASCRGSCARMPGWFIRDLYPQQLPGRLRADGRPMPRAMPSSARN